MSDSTPPPHPPLSGTIPEAFTTVPFEEARAARAVTVDRVRSFLDNQANHRYLLFDGYREECPEVAVVRDRAAVPATLWIVGDLHADVLTLANIIRFAETSAAEAGPPHFVFLGDFVDRGLHDHETLLLLFGLILDHPGRVCVIPGNHDIDLQWAEKAGRFWVTIEPAEYCERLNRVLASDAPDDRDQIELAKQFIRFCQARPKAVILPDGTLLAHGGFPHTDTHADLREAKDFGNVVCVNDFLWARISEGRRKRPNRGNRGHEFGWDDFAQFCRKSAGIGVPAVKRFVRGHDHILARWQLLPGYDEYPVLTVNAMGRRLDGEVGDGDPPLPVVARYILDQLPEVVRLPLDPTEVAKAFPRGLREPEGPAIDEDFGGPRVDPPQPAPEPGGGR